MSDLIDRQAVLDALIFDVRAGRQNGKTLMVRYAEEVIKRIKELPSAQPGEDIRAMCGECDAWNQYKNYPQPQWIPCSPETMPQEDGEYLVTIHWENGGYYTDLLIYKAYLKEWKNEDKIFGTVTAWQPKPKPCEGERDDNT